MWAAIVYNHFMHVKVISSDRGVAWDELGYHIALLLWCLQIFYIHLMQDTEHAGCQWST